MCYNGSKSVKTTILFECLIALFFYCFFSVFLKGWTLPENSGNSAGGYNNSYGNLLWKEGVITSQTSTSYATGGFQKLTSSPLSFLMSGTHNTTGTSLSNRGSYGYYWSRSASNASSSYYLHFLSGSVTPQYDYYLKPRGFPLRCVAW